ncbi:NPCBM/NEW2 domain-containing protein [Actinoplanes nipponensis]|uniref:Alpha-galactosidase n=1 Tax=Actinoplanes nipponensis TaxID=135950 RepID=A0A919JGU7_9ACTN|nr:NPCBM/NEW2 domain-containing protein [Actinoplanes nipponensis]GIE49247.1 alpha-galactosidase [Actinoplanes nipponensis]
MPHRTRLLRAVAAALLTTVAVVAPAAAPAAAAPSAAPLVSTPPMGFNDWNAFGCEVDERLIRETADAMVGAGLAAAGYRYVNIDDCWSARTRDADGRLVPDPVKFPAGIRGVADYVHARGLKLGIYGDAGTLTCAGYPGSLGHEDIDARTWAEWGVDYLKYDNCNNQSDGSQADYVRRYTAMRQALDRTGRPIVYSICEWGTSRPWEWARGVGDLWRTTGDISDNWASLRSIIAQNAPLYPYAGPGHFNDPDMLEIGNGGMTATEYRTHLSTWAMMAAPLIIGTDLRTASAETLAILGNREIIAVDQDPLGRQATVVSDHAGLMVLDKPLAGGDHAIALYNATDHLAAVGVPAADTGLPAAPAYRLRDLWTGRSVQAAATIEAAVPAHGTVVYRVRPLRGPETVPPAVTVAATLPTVVPGADSTAALTTTVTNRAPAPVRRVAVTAQAPAGWVVTPAGPDAQPRLGPDRSLATRWTVRAPDDTPAGRYPITVTARYTWGRGRAGATSSELVATVVTAPAAGRWALSKVPAYATANGLGPVEPDQSNGGAGIADGNLITIGGRHYTRGLGTAAPAELVYYLGGACTRLVTDVGVDDEAPAAAPATFTVDADGAVAATSGPLGSGAAPATLTADLTGVRWLRLVTTGAAGAHTDWADPVLSCGGAGPDDPVRPVRQTIFSFEDGTDGFTTANPGTGGAVAQSAAFHTDGSSGLRVETPVPGNWFGAPVPASLDLGGRSGLAFDLRTGDVGSVGEIAVQVGDALTWCQAGRWAWTDPHRSRTITESFDDIECPSGVTLDVTRIRVVWVFLNSGGVVHIDQVRAE